MDTNVEPTSRRPRRSAAATVTLAALMIGTLTGTPSASAAGPASPTDLSPDGPVSSNTPVLSWSKVARAVRYDVQVDDGAGFSSPEFTSSTTNNRAVPERVLRTGDQHWRVRAVNAANESSAWRTAHFDISPVAAPTPQSPVGGEKLTQPDMAPLLSWEGTQGATSYTVEVDTEDDFIGAKSYTTKTTSLVVPDPLEARMYWWRVTATKAEGVVSMPSTAETFEIEPLEPVVLTSPADHPDTKVTDVVLDWEPVDGAQYYQVRVATNADFTIGSIIDDQTKIFGTRYSPNVTYDNNQYYWQVRAVDLAGQPTDWSTVQNNFERHWPHRPQALHPAGASVVPVTGAAPYFQWSPVKHATQYQLEVGTDANFSFGTYESCQIAGTTYTPGNVILSGSSVARRTDEDCLMQPGSVQYWRVRPLDRPFTKSGNVLGVQGLYSATQAFQWNPSYFSNVTPVNGATVDVPSFSWDATRGADRYELKIFNSTGSLIKSATTYSTSYTPVGIPAIDPTRGPFTWTLRAIDAQGVSSVIQERTFHLSGDGAPTTGALPLTPLSGRASDPGTVRAPALRWEPHPDAAHYRLFVGSAGSGVFFTETPADALNKNLPYPNVTDTSTRLFAPGEYDWFVRAYSSTGAIVDQGPVSTFSVADFGLVQAQEIALDGLSLDAGFGCDARLSGDPAICEDVPSTPVLSWDPLPGMSLYAVYVSEDSSFTNLVETTVPATTNTRYAFTMSNISAALPESQAGQAYYWHIRPCKAVSVCAPDPISSTGMATNAFSKHSPAVELVSPANDIDPAGANVDTSEITFDWKDYFETNQATTFPATGELSPQAAMQYRIQVDDSPTFAGTVIDDQKVDQSTYTADHKLYPEGTLYWRVQAIDAEGNGLTWSETRSFVKSSPLAKVTSPTGGTHVSGTTPFRWSAQSFNASYKVEVFKNNDTTFSLANRVFSKDLKTPAYAWDQPLPSSPQPYVWRVRRTDASNNPGGWSVHGRFYSDGAVPTLVAPAADAYQPANGPLFTWENVPGATSYELAVRTAGSSVTWERVTTPATAWATDRTVPDGAWEWRVTALDVSRNTVGVSGWRDFRVDSTRPTVTRKTPRRKALRSANFTATFSEKVASVSSTTMRLYRKGSARPLRAKVTVDVTGRKATLNPKANLKAGKRYTIKLTSGIKDGAGNSLKPMSWTVRAK